MDALNHADQMRLANLINDNSDDAEIQKKLDQVVELTSSTRDQAAVALHDCHYDVEKAVDMILENGHAIVETQWKSAGKKKNKSTTSSQAKIGTQNQTGQQQQQHHHHHHHQQQQQSTATTGPGKNQHHNNNHQQQQQQHHNPHNHYHNNNQQQQQQQQHHGSSNINKLTNHPTSNAGNSTGSNSGASGSLHLSSSHHHKPDHHTNKNTNQTSPTNPSNQFTNNNNHNVNTKDASDSLKNLVGISSSNLIYSSDSTTTATANLNKTPSLSQPQHQPQQQQQTQHQQLQRSIHQATNRQHPQRSTRIPDSAVEMPSELQISSLNVQFGELDLRESALDNNDAKGAFQDVLDPKRQGRQPSLPNSHPAVSSQDGKTNRHISQQQLGKGGPRRQYNSHNSNNDDRRFYNNQNRGGRQISGNQRPHNQRSGPLNNPRGARTIMNRGPQTSNQSSLANSNSNQTSAGFPNSIDTWTNSTAEAATKTTNTGDQIGVANTLRVGQWSDVTGNEDWSEEDWDAKVMETKVFTPSSKAVDVTASNQKNQPLLADASVPSQINLASKLSENVRDDLGAQQNNLNAVSPQGQSQQTSQKSITHMNDIFDATVVKALEQQNLAAMKPKASIGISQYQNEPSEPKNVLDQQNLSSIKSKTAMSMNQYNREASESLKSLVGITSAKGGVPSVPPGALPSMIQPQYIMGNAYQTAIFPYHYQTPDVHYQVASQNAGRDQNFQSVYSPNDANKFNRGTDGDAPSITTTQAAQVASQTPSQAFVTNALHAGYPLTYAMPGAFNMMPQNLYSAAPIFPHIPQPTNTGSANTVYQKNTAASYQHHAPYSGYDHPLIQDYVNKQQNYSSSAGMQQQQQPTSKSSAVNNELDVSGGPNSYNMYNSVNKSQAQSNKQAPNYNDAKGYQQHVSGNGPQQQFGFSQHNIQQQPTSIAGYPLLQAHGLDGTSLNAQGNSQQLGSSQRGGNQVNSNKYYPNWS